MFFKFKVNKIEIFIIDTYFWKIFIYNSLENFRLPVKTINFNFCRRKIYIFLLIFSVLSSILNAPQGVYILSNKLSYLYCCYIHHYLYGEFQEDIFHILGIVFVLSTKLLQLTGKRICIVHQEFYTKGLGVFLCQFEDNLLSFCRHCMNFLILQLGVKLRHYI